MTSHISITSFRFLIHGHSCFIHAPPHPPPRHPIIPLASVDSFWKHNLDVIVTPENMSSRHSASSHVVLDGLAHTDPRSILSYCQLYLRWSLCAVWVFWEVTQMPFQLVLNAPSLSHTKHGPACSPGLRFPRCPPHCPK